jgi:hypothetical protein
MKKTLIFISKILMWFGFALMIGTAGKDDLNTITMLQTISCVFMSIALISFGGILYILNN